MINRYETLIRIFVPSWNYLSFRPICPRNVFCWMMAGSLLLARFLTEKDFGCGTEYFNHSSDRSLYP